MSEICTNSKTTPELFDDFSINTKLEIAHNAENVIKPSLNNHLHVFRIIQELITNSVKHGKANELAIYMEESTKNNGSLFIIPCKYHE